MRFAAILLTLTALSGPAFAQTSETQDHSAHHPPDVTGTSPSPSVDGTGSPTPKPAVSDRAAGSAAGMNCPMMPEMMQAMMKGMMQGMASGSGGAMAAGGTMAMGGMGGGTPAVMADQSLTAITYRAIAQRTVASLQANSAKGDAEFVRLATALDEALVDAAKVAAALSSDPEARNKAQQIVTAHEGELVRLRSWSEQAK